MTMEIIIRRATREDAPRMMELIRELAEYEREPHAVTVSMEHFVESGFGNQPVWWAFVAETDGVVQGFALYYIRYSTWKGQAMYLEDILVTEAMRGKGIGRLLFEQLFAEAREKGFRRICWQVLDWNEPAIGFYKQFGTRFDDGWTNCHLDF